MKRSVKDGSISPYYTWNSGNSGYRFFNLLQDSRQKETCPLKLLIGKRREREFRELKA